MSHVPGDDGGPSQEEHPDAIPALAISLDDLALVHHPVFIPAPDSSRIMHPKDVNVLDFEAIVLELSPGLAQSGHDR
jgi:hypothetical protein